MRKQTYPHTPVMVTTLCRFEHFRRCIESLSRCTGADETEVFIGVDYPYEESQMDGYNKICAYLQEISGFKEIHVFKRDKNIGQILNSRDLRDRILKLYDRYIVTEDDNEFSPNFLEYMNVCLEKYKNDPKVHCICGYCYKEWNNIDGYEKNAFPIKGFCFWGVGVYPDKMQEYRDFPNPSKVVESPGLVFSLFRKGQFVTIHRILLRLARRNASGGDVKRRLFMAANDKYAIFPAVSKVRNLGFDGSGQNCAVIDSYAQLPIDTSDSFILDDFEVKDYDSIHRLYKKQYSGNLLIRCSCVLEYLLYWLTGMSFYNFSLIRMIQKKRSR